MSTRGDAARARLEEGAGMCQEEPGLDWEIPGRQRGCSRVEAVGEQPHSSGRRELQSSRASALVVPNPFRVPFGKFYLC